MCKELSWYERYHIALKENLSVKDIMKLRAIGQPKALNIRKEALKYCLKNNISVECNKVPCDVVLKVTDRDLKYYYDKMLLEVEALKLRQTLAEM